MESSENRPSLKPFFLLGILALLTISCGPSSIGYAVLLLEEEGAEAETGAILPVLEESEIRDSYSVETPQGSSAELKKWRVAFFKDENQARSFRDAYTPWLNYYADNRKDGLAIRQEPTIESPRLYKLREGQNLKVLGRTAEKATVGEYDGYWYQVLTDDGVSGYCFELYLDIYDYQVRAREGESEEQDPLLDSFMEKAYRSQEMVDLLRAGTLDLNRFRTRYGLFPDPGNSTIHLVTPDFQKSFLYDSIDRSPSGRYLFTGSGLQITIKAENSIVLHYEKNDRDVAEDYYYIDKITTLIDEERERRDELYSTLQEMGELSSSAYGSLTFSEERIFQWRDFDRLVPEIIPAGISGTGTVSLDVLVAPSLRQSYDGVLALSFDGLETGPLYFLFDRGAGTLKLVYQPRGFVRDNLIREESPSPLVIFMTAAL